MQKCRTLNGDQRAALRETREIRRTHETHETDKTYKTQARRSNEQTETDSLQVRTPANARRNQLAGGTATGDCSFAMFAFMAGFSIRFGRSVQEVGWRRQVRFQRRSKATQSTPCGGIVPVMTRSAPTPSRRTSADSPGASAYRSASVQSSLRASSPTMDWSWMLRPISYVSLPVQNSAA